MSSSKNMPELPDRLGKIRNYYLRNAKLSERQEEYRKRIEHAYALLQTGYSRSGVVKIMARINGITEREIYRIISDALTLFGDLYKTNKEVMRVLISQQLDDTYRLAKMKGDVDGMHKALLAKAKVNGLMNDMGKDAPPLILPSIVFTSDASVLKNQNKELVDVEDIEFTEEISSGISEREAT